MFPKRILTPALCAGLAASALLVGCSGGAVGGVTATPFDNRHQCRNYDWRQVGIADGIRGYADIDARYQALAANCAQHGAMLNRDGYDAGYAEGRRRAAGG